MTKNNIYNGFKIAFAVVVASFIAEIIGLKFYLTAGVIALLGIMDNRRQTYIIGLKRLLTAVVAIVIAGLLFEVGGHHLLVFGLFMVIFVPLVSWFRLSEGLSISTVLVTHVFTLQMIDLQVILNEMGLLMIGIITAFVVNLHMPNVEREIRQFQEEVERSIKEILRKMAFQLKNQCSIDEQLSNLGDLDRLLSKGHQAAIKYNNNYILKDYSYYIEYFQMRREQYRVLKHMESLFQVIFTTEDQANRLYDYTIKIYDAFDECNSGVLQIEEGKGLLDYFRQSKLPKTREEFENRAVLYQYFNDLNYFLEIKATFMNKHGRVQYCDRSNH